MRVFTSISRSHTLNPKTNSGFYYDIPKTAARYSLENFKPKCPSNGQIVREFSIFQPKFGDISKISSPSSNPIATNDILS
jgi:hypothetical protein